MLNKQQWQWRLFTDWRRAVQLPKQCAEVVEACLMHVVRECVGVTPPGTPLGRMDEMAAAMLVTSSIGEIKMVSSCFNDTCSAFRRLVCWTVP